MLNGQERLWALLLHVLSVYFQRKLERMCTPEIEGTDNAAEGAEDQQGDDARGREDQRERLGLVMHVHAASSLAFVVTTRCSGGCQTRLLHER